MYYHDKAASLPAGWPYDRPPRSEREISEILLDRARRWAGDNLGAKLIGAVAPPNGAAYLGDWDGARFGADAAHRYFDGSKRVIDRTDDPYNKDPVVEVWGVQTPDGDVRRHVEVMDDERCTELTFSSSVHVRALGEALIAAADEIEQMNGYDQTG
jgi:hypothetical protein